MNIEKFYTKEVEIFEKVKYLNNELKELETIREFIFGNYDSNVSVTIEASSNYNFNNKTSKKILLPVDIILNDKITNEFVMKKLKLRIKNIKEELETLNIEFENLSK